MTITNPTVALVQHAPVFMNLAASVDKACTLINEAANQGAELIVFPETWLPGYPVWLDTAPEAGYWDHPPVNRLHQLLIDNAVQAGGPHLGSLQQAIRDAGVPMVIGAHERAGGTLYNTQYFFAADGTYQPHRKLMPTYTERLIWGRGDGSTLASVETKFGTLGGLICWEHWMPLARAAMHAKNEQVHVAQWPYVKELHQICSRHYAFEGQCIVAAAGGILSKQHMLDGIKSLSLGDDSPPIVEFLKAIPASNEELLLNGGSALIAPDTSYIVEPVYGESGIFYGQADLTAIARGNLRMDSDGHYSRPDVFNLQVNTSSQQNVTFSALSPDQ